MLNENLEENKYGNEQLPVYKLGKSQKIMAILLAFFALFVVVMWSVQFKQTLNAPFAYRGGGEEEADESKNLEALKAKDTDSDGLSDYDELYVYKTSPYLEDSDSDGISDGTEVAQGTDPNCPIGQNCFTGDSGASAGDSSASEYDFGPFDKLNQPAEGAAPSLSSEEEGALKEMFGSEIDAPALRQLLIERGMDKAMLDKISDEELMKSFSEILAE